jgi:hypothetical protein
MTRLKQELNSRAIHLEKRANDSQQLAAQLRDDADKADSAAAADLVLAAEYRALADKA